MSDSMHTPRIVDSLLLLDDVDDDFGDLEVVEDLLSLLTEDLEVLADAPSPAFLEALLAAVPAPRRAPRRGVRIAVTSGALFLAAAGTAAAATGSLPDSIQSAVHAAAESVGINVPDAEPQGPPTTGGSQDGAGHGRSDEAPGRPEQPGPPEDPSRSDEAPGQPEDPGSIGVGTEGVPSARSRTSTRTRPGSRTPTQVPPTRLATRPTRTARAIP